MFAGFVWNRHYNPQMNWLGFEIDLNGVKVTPRSDAWNGYNCQQLSHPCWHHCWQVLLVKSCLIHSSMIDGSCSWGRMGCQSLAGRYACTFTCSSIPVGNLEGFIHHLACFQEETREPRGNPHRPRENMKRTHSNLSIILVSGVWWSLVNLEAWSGNDTQCTGKVFFYC